MVDDVLLLAKERGLFRDFTIEHTDVAEEFLRFFAIVIDDLVRMLLAIETLLQQHLLFLASYIRVLDDVDVLVDLLGDHAVLLVAYRAHHFPLL